MLKYAKHTTLLNNQSHLTKLIQMKQLQKYRKLVLLFCLGGGYRGLNQGFMLARQAIYHLNYLPSPFVLRQGLGM
jgi:hypothetical protein